MVLKKPNSARKYDIRTTGWKPVTTGTNEMEEPYAGKDQKKHLRRIYW